MADITPLPFLRHLRSEPTAYVLRYRSGQLVKSGRGLSFWFRPINTSVAEIPLDTRAVPFLIRGTSQDFQEVSVQGELDYRIVNPKRVGERVDFSVHLGNGHWRREPLERLEALLVGLAEQFVLAWLAAQPVREHMTQGPGVVQATIASQLGDESQLAELGIELVAVRVSAVTPEPELARALQTPTREQLQQSADEATFARRALAVEKERAIAENELQNQIELARKESNLIDQEGTNARRRAEEAANAKGIEVEARANATRVDADAAAERIRLTEGARVEAEKARLDIYRELTPALVLGLAAQELAGKLTKIEHLNLTPDLLGSGLSRLLEAAEHRLEAGTPQRTS